jgi:hypothetical protein
MDYYKMLGDSCNYIHDGLINNIRNWSLLIIATLLFTVPLWGYLVTILRNEKPAPEIQDWGPLFSDGLKAIVIVVIYTIPLVLVNSILRHWLNVGMAGKSAAITGAVLSLVFLILVFGTGLTGITGLIRFARSGRIREAFNVDGTIGDIERVGWAGYSMGFIIIGLVVSIGAGIPLTIIAIILSAVFMPGYTYPGVLIFSLAMIIIGLLITPLVSVFLSRYIVQVYDRGYE